MVKKMGRKKGNIGVWMSASLVAVLVTFAMFVFMLNNDDSSLSRLITGSNSSCEPTVIDCTDCNKKLEQLEKEKHKYEDRCPPCESSKSGIFWFAIGIVVYASSLLYFFWQRDKLKKEREQLDEVRKDIAQQIKGIKKLIKNGSDQTRRKKN